MNEHPDFPAGFLNQAGINRQHVFDVNCLPPELLSTLGETQGYRQLILLGHGGKALWDCVKASGTGSNDPIDDYSMQTVRRWFADFLPERRFQFVYPGEQSVGLQHLGKLAGWHQPSPFMVGIDAEWGSWFAYRAVVLTDTDFSPSLPVVRGNPCLTCQNKPCISACPAGAVAEDLFSISGCAGFRLQAVSACAYACLARQACPVGSIHRYDDDQVRHSYLHSLAMLRPYI
jgi:hypothetical protein